MFSGVRFLLAVVLVSSNIQAQNSSALGGLDVSLFRQINDRQTEGDGPIEYVDRFSIPVMLITPTAMIVYGTAEDRDVFESGMMVAASGLLAFGTTVLLKAIVDRPRPFDALEDVRVKHRASARGASFPSGHSSTTAALATMLIIRHPNVSVIIPSLLWTAAVGYGRIYLGVHYPSDVVGGFLLGIASAFVIHSMEADFRKMGDWLFGKRTTHGITPTPRVLLFSVSIPMN
jgi:undecaprenyl-diphosphatase